MKHQDIRDKNSSYLSFFGLRPKMPSTINVRKLAEAAGNCAKHVLYLFLII